MTKEERKSELQQKLEANELLYDGVLGVKRVMNTSELAELSQALGSSNREMLNNFVGGSNQHALKSLIKSNALKVKRTYGIGNRRAFNGLYTEKLDNDLLDNWFMLSKVVWFLREKGLRLGKVSRLKDTQDLQATVSFDDKTVSKLQFKVVDDLTKPISADPGYTLVAVFRSFDLMAESINSHRDLLANPIEDGCLMVCLRQVEDFETILGYSLGVQEKDDESSISLGSIVNRQSLDEVDFKQCVKSPSNTVTQLDWEYDEALRRNTTKTSKSN